MNLSSPRELIAVIVLLSERNHFRLLNTVGCGTDQVVNIFPIGFHEDEDPNF
jgi:hypothetical protein